MYVHRLLTTQVPDFSLGLCIVARIEHIEETTITTTGLLPSHHKNSVHMVVCYYVHTAVVTRHTWIDFVLCKRYAWHYNSAHEGVMILQMN